MRKYFMLALIMLSSLISYCHLPMLGSSKDEVMRSIATDPLLNNPVVTRSPKGTICITATHKDSEIEVWYFDEDDSVFEHHLIINNDKLANFISFMNDKFIKDKAREDEWIEFIEGQKPYYHALRKSNGRYYVTTTWTEVE